jgi:hypothetical protein
LGWLFGVALNATNNVRKKRLHPEFPTAGEFAGLNKNNPSPKEERLQALASDARKQPGH